MSHANIFRLPALRLRGKIVFAAAAVFTIAIGATLAYVLTTAHNTDLAAADSQVANLAQAKADEINLYLSPYAAAAASLARTAEVLLANPDIGPELYKSVAAAQLGDLPDALSTLMMFHSDAGLATRPSFVGSAAILSKDYVGFDAERDPADASKRVFKSLDPSATKVGYENWFEAPLATGQPSITGPTNYAGLLYTSFDGIIHDATGKAVGITSVSFNGAVLAKTLAADASASPTSFVGIINQDGNWVQYIDPKQIGQPVKDQFALDAMAALKTGVPLYQRTDPYLGDTWRLTAIKAKLPGSDQEWTVLVSKPEAVLLKASNEQMRNMLIGSGIVLVLGLLAFAGVGTYIARPVIRMTGVMGKIADGQFDIDVPYATRADEIGDMSKTLEVFRARGIELTKMTEAEAARVIRDAKTQADTLTGLQMAFGEVVDAAIAGNFTKRVEANLGFDQLNAIANGINKLVERSAAG